MNNDLFASAEKMTPYEFSSTSSMCDVLKSMGEFVQSITSEKTKKYDMAIGMSDIFKYVIDDKEGSPKEMFEYVAEVTDYETDLEDSGVFDANNEAKAIETKKKAFRWKRYCESELSRKRTNYADVLPMEEIEVGGLYLMDYAPQRFCVEKSLCGGIRIESIRYKDAKAPTGKNGNMDILDEVRAYDDECDRRKEPIDNLSDDRLKNVPKWTYEYLGLKYIEKIIEDPEIQVILGINPGDKIVATGSTYYMEMKSNDDKVADFFAGYSNIFSLTETYIVGQPNPIDTELDEIFKDYSVKLNVGKKSTQCTKDDCKLCKLQSFCGFQKANKKVEEAKASSNAKSDYEPTPSQKAIIDAAIALIEEDKEK